jgi:hypothetical protein
MNDRSVGRLGGICSILMGGLSILLAITFFLDPVAQADTRGPAAFWTTAAASPGMLITNLWLVVLHGILALAVVPAFAAVVSPANEGWVRWASAVAYLTFGMRVVDNIQSSMAVPFRAAMYATGDHATRVAVEAAGLSLDPQSILSFGGVAFWLSVVSVLALRKGLLPRPLAYVGLATAIVHWLVPPSVLIGVGLLGMPILYQLASGLAYIVFAPIWFIWGGLWLRQAGYNDGSSRQGVEIGDQRQLAS